MIPFEKAYEIVMQTGFSTGYEIIDFKISLNRVLAENVISDVDMPPFDKASMDGFACRKSDLAFDLEIIETIAAGCSPEKQIGSCQCSRIMTGAAVPEGADCVVMVEDTEIIASGKVRFRGKFVKENISKKGEDVCKGDIVLKAGKLISPQDIAVLASTGHTSVRVGKKPSVAVISTGNEIVEPWIIPGMSQIRNSNSYQLMAQLERTGALGKYYGIAMDEELTTFRLVERAISENDIVLITGGVSMGDFDFVPAVMEKAGVNILFTRVAVQPGKPTTFGIAGEKVVFGLPGNPVSSFVQFEMLVRPLICKMMGFEWKPVTINLPLREGFSRKSADRMALVPVVITDNGFASIVEFHGSGHITSLPYSDGIISVPAGIFTLTRGEIVNVRQI
jgi:molybdopterin molybdotransferase